ncbi:MAG: NUDIX domain-containing protein [Chloroflexi bacterium]|nr:NUDIX domain-containing protein [Chloroflexota bacterium]MCY3583621.1 NUDIX domain-containing protein [Chloroflexota bacterium]MCY3716589.1 NUDIX domain-containing protein [Chloroflexota bacterium]MDE2651276.1 NUDIX domain-containing protein [Chloroflexota bacterium]
MASSYWAWSMGAAEPGQPPRRLAAILRLLDRHSPADAKEAHDIQRIRQLVHERHDILSARCQVGHITASALIIDCASGRILLHFHRKLKRWLQVGGHLETGESDPALAALREAREETGLPDLVFCPQAAMPLDIDVQNIPARADMPAHLHLDFRYLLATRHPQALAPEPGESAQFRWLTVQGTLAMGAALDSSLRRLLRKAEGIG